MFYVKNVPNGERVIRTFAGLLLVVAAVLGQPMLGSLGGAVLAVAIFSTVFLIVTGFAAGAQHVHSSAVRLNKMPSTSRKRTRSENPDHTRRVGIGCLLAVITVAGIVLSATRRVFIDWPGTLPFVVQGASSMVRVNGGLARALFGAFGVWMYAG